MRVRFSDPDGPRLARAAVFAVPLSMVALALFGPPTGGAAAALGFGGVTLFNLLGLLPLRQRRPRDATLVCHPGSVSIVKAGSRTQRIHAVDVTGATTARTDRGVLLTLQHARRHQPVTIEVETEEQAAEVRRALGIGHDGFGVITWRTLPNSMGRAAIIGRVIATLTTLLVAAVALSSGADAALGLGMLLAQFTVIGTILGIAGLVDGAAPSIVMSAEGLRLKTPKAWFAVPYEAVFGVASHRRALVFSVPAPYHTVSVEGVGLIQGGASDADRDVIAAQILAAGARARGHVRPKEEAEGRVDVLRRSGASAREWLLRLDAAAGQMLAAGAGYRGGTLEPRDLWAILEDPDADAELRAAAARVLRHSPEPTTRTRIASAVAAVRDESAQRRLRIALSDDVEDASKALGYLDAELEIAARARARALR